MQKLYTLIALLLMLAAAGLFYMTWKQPSGPAPNSPDLSASPPFSNPPGSPPPSALSASDIEVYFSSPKMAKKAKSASQASSQKANPASADGKPEAPAAVASENELAQRLCQWVAASQHSLQISAFEINLPCLLQALPQLQAKGVQLRIVTDSDHLDEVKSLQAAGIAIRHDQRSAFMHNKFLVRDNEQVWTGSLNLTRNGVERNHNNVLVLHSPALAADYAQEFAELWDGKFGPGSPRQQRPDHYQLGQTPVEVFFSPEDPVRERLLQLVAAAQKRIVVLAFSFTDDALGEAMLERLKAGVKLQGVFEKSGAGSKYSEYARLKKAGADLRRDGNPGVMHHKVLIIDDQWLVTGSYNFSQNADRSNDENLLVLQSPSLASAYLQEFERIYADGQP